MTDTDAIGHLEDALGFVLATLEKCELPTLARSNLMIARTHIDVALMHGREKVGEGA